MIDFQNVSFSYGEESSGGGIRNVNLTINTGEFVLLTGESGCGKTTITRLVNGLVPHYYEGNLEGDVLLDGKSVSDTPLYDLAAMVGSVFQNPKSQFFNVDTDSELAFACENLGYPQEDILKRIDRTVSDYHIEDLMGRSVFALSGGEKQKIACASSSVLLPGIMVLDEPSSNLDMAAIDDLRQVLSLWKKQGKTILIAEHRLYYLHDLADRVLYVKDGEIEREYTPAEFDSLSDGTRKEMGLRPFSLSKLKPANQYQAHTAKQMEFQNFCFAYKKREPESLHIPSAELPVGETIAIIGLNGAGKSTLARCICGLEKKCGLLQVDGKTLDWKARLKHCYMVMQDTSHQLFTESVTDEVLLSIDNEDETVVDKILKQFDLLEYKDRHPLSLSGGQKQRVAIASAIVSNREIIVFDEPTSGLDLKHMREVARSLKSLADQGKTLLVITHDPELVMAGCSYVVHMEKGQIKESYPLDESGSKKVLDFFRIPVVLFTDEICCLLFVCIHPLGVVTGVLQLFLQILYISLFEDQCLIFHDLCALWNVGYQTAVSIAHCLQQAQGHSLQIRWQRVDIGVTVQFIQHRSLYKPGKEDSIVILRQFFQFFHKGIGITGAACDDQFLIRLDIFEGLDQISNTLFRHQTPEEQYV